MLLMRSRILIRLNYVIGFAPPPPPNFFVVARSLRHCTGLNNPSVNSPECKDPELPFGPRGDSRVRWMIFD